VYSWDIVVTKVDDKLFFDKRDDSDIDMLSVNETAPETPSAKDETMNGRSALAKEATFINQYFSQAALSQANSPALSLDEKNPFASNSQNLAPVAYYYRLWNLGNNLTMIVRSEAHACQIVGEDHELMTVHALNEYDAKQTKYRQKLDGQRGNVFAREVINNTGKIGRWIAESYLVDADKSAIGFISRAKEKDRDNHLILGCQVYKTTDLFKQTGLKISQMWGVVMLIIETCLEQQNGKYIILKEPTQPKITLYRVGESN